MAGTMEEGLEAFQAGELEQALEHFETARARGEQSPQLRFNLGVTYYRLARYEQAEAQFRTLLEEPEWEALARYNLGRVADRQGRVQAAARHYREARGATSDAALYQLAGEALQDLEERHPERGRLLALAGVGYDDNVTLGGEADQLGVSREADLFTDVLVAGDWLLGDPREDGWRLSGSGYLRTHLDVQEFDFAVFQPGIWRDDVLGDWQISSGAFVDFTYLDWDHFTTTYSVSGQAARALEMGGQLHLRGRLGYVNAGSGYRDFSGQQHRFGVEWRGEYGGMPVSTGYRLELNDRRDLKDGDLFLSRSPVRHQFHLRGEVDVAEDWWLLPEVVYRHSRYRDPDRRDIDTDPRRRSDDRWVIRLRAEHAVDREWLFFAEYEHTDEEETTFSEDAYSRSVLMLGVEYVR